MYQCLNRLTNLFPQDIVPSDFFAGEDGTPLIENIYFLDYSLTPMPAGLGFQIRLAILGEMTVTIPGLEGMSFVFGAGEVEGTTAINLIVYMGMDDFELRFEDVKVALRFSPSILKPVPAKGELQAPPYAEISTSGHIVIDKNLEIHLEGFDGLSLAPVMVGDSGVIISAENIKFDFSRTETLPEVIAVGFDESFMGIYIGEAKVQLPEGLPAAAPEDLLLRNCAIGTGGVSGRLEFHYTPVFDSASKAFTGRGAGELFGIPFGLGDVILEFKQNAFKESSISGRLLLPFFEQPLAVEIGLSLEGGFTVRLTGATDELLTLERANFVRLKVDSLGFHYEDGIFAVILSGDLTPLFGAPALDWPTFEVKELVIDSEGNVDMEGGWLNLPSQKTFSLHGFRMEITALGFGTQEDGKRWIGFNGGVRLVDSLPVGASVEGLRLLWDPVTNDIDISFKGVGVTFEVADVLKFEGEVAYTEDGNLSRFDGEIGLDLITLGMSMDAKLVIGRRSAEPPYTFFYMYLNADLPAGIPLFATGLGLYGMAGLFALNMEPRKPKTMSWYENADGSPGWYLATSIEGNTTEVGVSDTKKWCDKLDGLALGAGVTVATLSDNGYAFSAKVLLVIVFPGPILLIEGKANILKERTKLDEEAIFRALAVFDSRAGTFLFNADARYLLNDPDAYILDIHAGAEAFFDLNDADHWHVYLGRDEPREKRIRAEVLRILEANSYFMLKPTSVATGAWLGYAKQWSFDPLRVTLEAWIEGNAYLSWKPVHFKGDLSLHGAVELSVFGFGLRLSLDARFAVETPSPWDILGEFSVGIDLPWFLPDFDVTITLHWHKDTWALPVPLPLQEITLEHLLTTEKWSLLRTGSKPLLLPNYDADANGFVDSPGAALTVSSAQDAAARTAAPVIPLDGRPRLTFARNVHDEAKASVNVQPVSPDYEKVGETKYKFSLSALVLERWDGSTWQHVAHAPAAPSDHKEQILYGAWAPVPTVPREAGATENVPGQTKLWLWSMNPFDYTRRVNRTWDEWFTEHYPNYPCIPEAKDIQFCYDLESIAVGTQALAPWAHPEELGLVFEWLSIFNPRVIVDNVSTDVGDRTHAFFFEDLRDSDLMIRLPQTAKAVTLLMVTGEIASAIAFDDQGKQITKGSIKAGERKLELKGDGISWVCIEGSWVWVLGICYVVGPDAAEIARREEMAEHIRDEVARWYSEEGEAIFEPNTDYRLTIETKVDVLGDSTYPLREYAYFRTEGPPGLTQLSPPANWRPPPGGEEPKQFVSALKDVTLYVKNTVPADGVRPVYCAYDMGVAFNQNYVKLMYRKAGRDLGLYLFDNNNQPVRDARGRLIVFDHAWGKDTELRLDYSDDRYVWLLGQQPCVEIDLERIPHKDMLTSSAEGRVLDSDTFYEARLVPLLLHEDFNVEDLDTWTEWTEGSNQRPAYWRLGSEPLPDGGESHYVMQTSNVWGGTVGGTDPVKPGTALLRGDPDWTGYRLTIVLRAVTDNDAIGVLFRYQDADNYYRFSMDRERRYRRLVRVVDGVTTVLAEDDFVYQVDRDYVVTVEAIGASLRVYLEGALVFDVIDASLERGKIGLYCWAHRGARFSDVRVDDFRADAPVIYRFQFTTSRYANFFHQLHSFQDEVWTHSLPAGGPTDAQISTHSGTAVVPTMAPTLAETKDCEALEKLLFGLGHRAIPKQFEVTRIERDGTPLLLLLESPEPIDWARTELEVLRAARRVTRPTTPGAVKLTGGVLPPTDPRVSPDYNTESVDLLLRQATDLSRVCVEYRHLPGMVEQAPGDPRLFTDEFATGSAGLLFEEDFGPNALDHWAVMDDGGQLGPSHWQVSGGEIIQTSKIYGGSTAAKSSMKIGHHQFGRLPMRIWRQSRAHSAGAPNPLATKFMLRPEWVKVRAQGPPEHKPGTYIVTGDPNWTDIRLLVRLRSTDDDAIGVMFRYQDADNYYRFSMDRERSYRRLVRVVDGVVTTLWEDHIPYDLGRSYELRIEAVRSSLVGSLNEGLLFVIDDSYLNKGQIGLYCWANTGAHFEGVRVESLSPPLILWQPGFADLGELTIVDEGDQQAPSTWAVIDGELVQTSNIWGGSLSGAVPDKPGTYALAGSSTWRDVAISIRLRSTDDDAIGVMFRYQDADNYYRFSMDRERKYRRLIKKAAGVVTILWQDAVAYAPDRSYELALTAVGTQISGYLDGELLFNVQDGDLLRGQIGLYCWGNTGAHFERVLVTDHARRIGAWTIVDQGQYVGPSRWALRHGALVQASNMWGGVLDGTVPDKPGTFALAGDPTWTDVRLMVELRSDDDDAIGLMFRVRDERNYYRLSLDSQRSYRRLVRVQNGTVTTLWEDAGSYQQGISFTLTIDAVGKRLVGYQGDAWLFEVTDEEHAGGRIGLYCWGNTGARFERVEVTRPPLEALALFHDHFAAGDISAWTIIDEGTHQPPSNWALEDGVLKQSSNIWGGVRRGTVSNKPGTYAVAGDATWADVVLRVRLASSDNDAIGVMFRYQDADNYYRFSMDSQRRYRRLIKKAPAGVTVLWEDNVRYELNRAYTITIAAVGDQLTGYLDGAPVFSLADNTDPIMTGRIALYCWGNVGAQFSEVWVYPPAVIPSEALFVEPFEPNALNRWTIVDEGTHEAPSSWAVMDGALIQSRNIWGGVLDGTVPDKPSTYVYAGDPTWTDYRLIVHLQSNDDDGIGVMFRYQDTDNYYRFSMDRQRHYRRLIKKASGVITVLWEDDERYTVGRPYMLTLDCIGDRLSGYLNGVLLFSVSDTGLSQGSIGLYCWGNIGARFGGVAVVAPISSPYYRFSAEERLPAGTRVRVHAGSLLDHTSPESGIAHRYVAGTGTRGRFRLPPDGCELRLQLSDGAVGHARTVLPDNAYSPQTIKVLRNGDGKELGDGTRLFLIFPDAGPAGTALPSGEIRLRFTYRRDNTTTDPESVVLSQAGQTAPEEVVLDVPREE